MIDYNLKMLRFSKRNVLITEIKKENELRTITNYECDDDY